MARARNSVIARVMEERVLYYLYYILFHLLKLLKAT